MVNGSAELPQTTPFDRQLVAPQLETNELAAVRRRSLLVHFETGRLEPFAHALGGRGS